MDSDGAHRSTGGDVELSCSCTVRAEVVSELGIFGWALVNSESKKAAAMGEVREKTVGWLTRTKGVAAGFSTPFRYL
jgi:hypothetical protein